MAVKAGCGASAVHEGYAVLYVGSPEECGSMLEDSVGYPPDLAAVDMTAIASAITIDSSGQYVVEGLAYS